MATNLKAKRQKLYFNLQFPKSTTNAVRCCTQFSAGTSGDRYGNLLQALEALTGSSPSSTKTRAEVSAWFVPNLAVFSAANATAPAPSFAVSFVQPTVSNSGAGAKRLPYLTNGTLTPLNQFSGVSAIYSITNTGAPRHFGVMVQRRGGSTASVAGTLYVQRQHSIEV